MIILVIFRCVVRSFFFISSYTVHVLEAWRSDGVTVASKSLSLSLSGYFGDVSSCLWLVNVGHAHLMRWPNSTWTAFLKVMSWPRCLTFLFWWQDLDALFLNRYRDVFRVRWVQLQAVCCCGCGEVV